MTDAAQNILREVQLGDDVLGIAEFLRVPFKEIAETNVVSEADFLVLTYTALQQTSCLRYGHQIRRITFAARCALRTCTIRPP